MQQTLKLEEKQNKKRILYYVKAHLFKNLKFIPSQDMMTFSNSDKSLNHLVFNAVNIRVDNQQSYWLKYYKYVKTALKAARNDAVSAVKKSFIKGKIIVSYSCKKTHTSTMSFFCVKITSKHAKKMASHWWCCLKFWF